MGADRQRQRLALPDPGALVVRPTWVVAATPKDRYYLFGKIVLWIDRETYKISNVVKYDWKGAPVGVFNRAISYGRAPDGYRGRGGAYAENIKLDRATTGEPSPARSAPNVLDGSIEAKEFEAERLVRMGR